VDGGSVFWGDYKEALKWLFYKLTQSRPLHDNELKHLGTKLLGHKELFASINFGPKEGDVSEISTQKSLFFDLICKDFF
jgi:hypothetical protein